MKFLHEYEPGRAVIAHYDQADRAMIFEERIDNGPVAEAAKVLADEPPGKDFRHIAEIPIDVWNRAIVEGWVHDKAAWRKWYMDPDNRGFCVHAGRNTNFHSMFGG